MSTYTDARSKPGNRLTSGTDDRELFLTEFGQMVLEAEKQVADYEELSFQKTITEGKADTFPIIGRKRTASEHTPGEIILGGSIEHNDITVSLDKVLVDSIFLAEIDELMNHFELRGPYARQLAESIGMAYNARIAQLHILASRVTTPPYTGGPVPSYYFHANAKTDASKLEEAAFAAAVYHKQNDISGAPLQFRLPWAQYFLAARYSGVEGGPVTTGSGDRAAGTIGTMAGIPLKGTNSIPTTNITSGATKYQGNFTTTVGHIGNEMAVATLNRRGLKVVIKEQEDRIGTLLIASRFRGSGILRPECSFEVATATR